jgi:hypothetical protein
MQLACGHAEIYETAQLYNQAFEAESFPISSSQTSALARWKSKRPTTECWTPKIHSEHWRGLQPDPNHRLLIRGSLVRAQFGEPRKSRGYVQRRSPFVVPDTVAGFAAFRLRFHASRV